MTISKASEQISSVSVEYDKGKTRAVKTFDNPFRAKSFYTQKFKAGKNPKIVSASR